MRRLWISVFCGKEELLMVRTLIILTFKIFNMRENLNNTLKKSNTLKRITGPLQVKYLNTLRHKLNFSSSFSPHKGLSILDQWNQNYLHWYKSLGVNEKIRFPGWSHPYMCAICMCALYVHACGYPFLSLYNPWALKLTLPISLLWKRARVLSVWPPAASETHPRHLWGV